VPPEAATDAPTVRRRTSTLAEIYRGPFRSSRLFAMPTADVVGAYVMTVSGEGSLLQQPGALTSAGVLAIGFGDIAQLEYRHTSAISVEGVTAPVPAVGVQLAIPLPRRPGIPAFGVAFRLGVPRDEQIDAFELEEKVTDLYLVARWRGGAAGWLTLHGGTRVSSASLTVTDAMGLAIGTVEKRLVLPTGGLELQMNDEAKLVAEAGLAPRFMWMPGADPAIGYGLLARLGLRWSVLPSVIFDGSIGYQQEVGTVEPPAGRGGIVQWDIRLGAEVFVPWGALACRATGAFCD